MVFPHTPFSLRGEELHTAFACISAVKLPINDGAHRCSCRGVVSIRLTTCLTAKVKQVFSWEDNMEHILLGNGIAALKRQRRHEK